MYSIHPDSFSDRFNACDPSRCYIWIRKLCSLGF
jgi:hypothetical protein